MKQKSKSVPNTVIIQEVWMLPFIFFQFLLDLGEYCPDAFKDTVGNYEWMLLKGVQLSLKFLAGLLKPLLHLMVSVYLPCYHIKSSFLILKTNLMWNPQTVSKLSEDAEEFIACLRGVAVQV